MFGKSKRSSADNFVMAQGRKNGNLKSAGTPFNKGKALKTSPVAKPKGDSDRKSVKVLNNTKPSPGQVNTFKTRGK